MDVEFLARLQFIALAAIGIFPNLVQSNPNPELFRYARNDNYEDLSLRGNIVTEAISILNITNGSYPEIGTYTIVNRKPVSEASVIEI